MNAMARLVVFAVSLGLLGSAFAGPLSWLTSEAEGSGMSPREQSQVLGTPKLTTSERSFTEEDFVGSWTLLTQFHYQGESSESSQKCPLHIRHKRVEYIRHSQGPMAQLNYGDMEIGGHWSQSKTDPMEWYLKPCKNDGYLSLYSSTYLKNTDGIDRIDEELESEESSGISIGSDISSRRELFRQVWKVLPNEVFWVGTAEKTMPRHCPNPDTENNPAPDPNEPVDPEEYFFNEEFFLFIDEPREINLNVALFPSSDGGYHRLGVSLKTGQRYMIVTGKSYTCIYHVLAEYIEQAVRPDRRCLVQCEEISTTEEP